MLTFDSLDQTTITAPTILTIGKFNGMHRGHQSLLAQITARAATINGVSAAITFDPHPTLVLQPDIQRVYLAPEQDQRHWFDESGLDYLIVERYDETLRQQSAAAFMQRVCHAMPLRELWVGPDFRIGYRAQGTVAVLHELGAQLGFSVHVIEPLTIGDEPVSSTRIRTQLQAGDVAAIQPLLGRPFALEGVVVHGDQRGRTIGFPTANMNPGPQHLLPADGVYATTTTIADGTTHPSVTNIGVRPTFGTLNRTVESHLLDWNGDLYDQPIRLQFHQRIRAEQRFNGIEELKAQIARDVASARTMLA